MQVDGALVRGKTEVPDPDLLRALLRGLRQLDVDARAQRQARATVAVSLGPDRHHRVSGRGSTDLGVLRAEHLHEDLFSEARPLFSQHDRLGL